MVSAAAGAINALTGASESDVASTVRTDPLQNS